MALSLAEKEDLKDMLTHPGVGAVMKLFEECKAAIEADVLRFNLASGDEKGLVHAKARAEGADKMLRAVRSSIEALKQKPKKGD